MREKIKKVLTMFLALVLFVNISGFSSMAVSYEGSGETEAALEQPEETEEQTKAVAVQQETEKQTEAVIEPLGETEEQTEAVTEPLENTDNLAGQQIITGFEPLKEDVIQFEKKQPLSEIIFPGQIKVYINNTDTAVPISVSWVCDDDYENTEYELYTFTPVWDEQQYILAENVDIFSVPYIEVEINGVKNPNARDGDEVTTQESDFNYSTNNDTITITGLTASFLSSLTDNQKQNIHLVIPESIGGVAVTEIGGKAFSAKWNSTYKGYRFVSLDLSSTINLQKIGEYAFENASDLQGSLVIPDQVVEIGAYAFSGCKGFSGSLQLPQNLQSVGRYAFCNSGFGGELNLPESLQTIGDSAFRISESGLSGFSGELVIPGNVTKIDQIAFSGNAGITSVRFEGTSLKEIPTSAFRNCGLTGSLTIPSNIQKVGANAFNGTNLETVYLPKMDDQSNTEFLQSSTFGSSPKLNAIVCDELDYSIIKNLVGSTLSKKLGYEVQIKFMDGDGQAADSISRLYNRPFNYTKDINGVWKADSTYRFPVIQGKGWGLSASAVKEVSETDNVTQEKLYAIVPLADPVYTYSDGIDKVYDGLPQTLTVTAEHPLAKPIGKASVGDVVFYYSWYWLTLNSVQTEFEGFDKDSYEVTDVREPGFAIACRVKIEACVINEKNGKYVATSFKTTYHDFSVNLRQAPSTVTPVYPKGMINIADGMPEISLSVGDTEGTVSWNAGQTLQAGKNEYTWTFIPKINSADSYNYETVTGKAELNGVDGKVFNIEVNKADHGQISPGDAFETVQGTDIELKFKADDGYMLESVIVDGTDVIDRVIKNKYTIADIQADHTVGAVFSLMSSKDVEEIIEQIPQVPEGAVPDPEQQESILDAKRHYEALAEDAQAAVTEDSKKQLNEAIAKLPGVEVKVSGDVIVEDKNMLLENMTSEEAEKLQQSNNGAYRIELVVEEEVPEQSEGEAIENQLAGATMYKNFNVRVLKTVRADSQESTEHINVLRTPVSLIFNIPAEIRQAPAGYTREIFIVRAHTSDGITTAEILPHKDIDESTILVVSDKFSAYSIAYKDTQIKYAVSFDSQGGNAIDSMDGVAYGDKIKPPAEPVRNGYIFTGWYGDQQCTEMWNFEEYAITSDMTLYAGWRPVESESEEMSETEQTTEPGKMTESEGESGTEKPTETEEIAESEKPAETEEASESEKMTETEGMSETEAGKTPPASEAVFTVSFDSQGGSAVESMTGIVKNSLIQSPASPKRDNYLFTGWYTEKECIRLWDFENDRVSGNMTLYAGWNQVKSGTNNSQNPQSPGNTQTPKTGDNTDSRGLWGTAAGSLLVMFSMLALRRKKKDKFEKR
ncbi:InlB B-repeat-containing protein [Murimonas intestini]|uniref:Repeat protein (TIGR02543 family) n=1 Tax=Murimonas intestini TaxID=1337051 RepID=A0AB73T1Y6_9FIRM|nr:InlB B-repeat-containing protein [Murimonas intestini]MCR1842581.1 InlB B-repeat-containing protein [Murimonas intestini]MCR1867372.1 InlB B-repeat-containing protein [Murimonas intestini]MCR1884559.1 InlB B-repeat-containing protein [Murimonas intestini]